MDAESLRGLAEEHTERFAVSHAKRYPYERAAVAEVQAALLRPASERHAVVLDGPRRSGKSVALRQLTSRLRSDDPARVRYCDLTDPRLAGTSLHSLVEALVPPEADSTRPTVLLIDEVHYGGEQWARELKFAVDNLPVRLAVADSAVAVVRSGVNQELVGRVTEVRMHPLSFTEWRELRAALQRPVASERDEAGLLRECREYLDLGGFPRHVDRRGELLAVQDELRRNVIRMAIREDIGRLHGLRDVDQLERLFVSRLAASGAQLSVREDAKRSAKSEPTIRHWLRAMMDTGLLWPLDARVRSAGKYERGQPKLYAVDPSLIGACSLPVFGPGVVDPALLARQVETAVAQSLRMFCERTGARLAFYQRKTSAGWGSGEVDFVVEHEKQVYAIEVMVRDDRKKVKDLAQRAAELGATWAAVVSLRLRAETDATGRSPVHLLPLQELLLRLSPPGRIWPW